MKSDSKNKVLLLSSFKREQGTKILRCLMLLIATLDAKKLPKVLLVFHSKHYFSVFFFLSLSFVMP